MELELEWSGVEWSGVESVCAIKHIHPAARDPNGSWQLLDFSYYMADILSSSARPCDVLLPKWGTPYPTPSRPPKNEHKQRKRTVSTPSSPPSSSHPVLPPTTICPTFESRRKGKTALAALSSSNTKATLGALGCFHSQRVPTVFHMFLIGGFQAQHSTKGR